MKLWKVTVAVPLALLGCTTLDTVPEPNPFGEGTQCVELDAYQSENLIIDISLQSMQNRLKGASNPYDKGQVIRAQFCNPPQSDEIRYGWFDKDHRQFIWNPNELLWDITYSRICEQTTYSLQARDELGNNTYIYLLSQGLRDFFREVELMDKCPSASYIGRQEITLECNEKYARSGYRNKAKKISECIEERLAADQ